MTKKISQTVYLVRVLSDKSIHKVHVNQLREYYVPKPHSPNPDKLHTKTPSPRHVPSPSPPRPSPVNNSTNPRPSPPVSQPSPTSPLQQTSSRGRVIKPTKRFTFSEFD